MSPRPIKEHVIAEISYQDDRLVCSCGVVMRADPRGNEWAIHRKGLGLAVVGVGQSIGKRRAAAATQPSVWRPRG